MAAWLQVLYFLQPAWLIYHNVKCKLVANFLSAINLMYVGAETQTEVNSSSQQKQLLIWTRNMLFLVALLRAWPSSKIQSSNLLIQETIDRSKTAGGLPIVFKKDKNFQRNTLILQRTFILFKIETMLFSLFCFHQTHLNIRSSSILDPSTSLNSIQ